MKQSLIVLFLGFPFGLSAQNVGIGIANPAARLHVADSAVVFSAAGFVPELPGKTAIEGAGRRMMWHPDKAAFRAGYVTGDAWNDINIGRFSFAAGKDVVAQTTGSIAIGLDNRVEGYAGMAIGSNSFSGYSYGIAIGNNAQSRGAEAVAIGNDVTAKDNTNGFVIGNGSTVTSLKGFAIGNQLNVTASQAFAFGNNLTASGQGAMAVGNSSSANGANSLAMGYFNSTSADYATALGSNNLASNAYATAIGRSNTAGGFAALAFGNNSVASGGNSTAIGYFTTASGTNSFAIGSSVSTSGYKGAFALGDASTTTVMTSFVADGFRARFAGGYRLFTNSAATIGAVLNAGSNSWAALSDKRLKENFVPVDGEVFLKRIADMPLTTWNYIGQDVKTLRHYGPMAQDFYAAFGNDALGEIGCDTLINQQDFLGVNLIAIQALEKRTEKMEELEKKIQKMEMENALLKEQMNALLEAIKAGKGAGTVRQ